MTHGAHGAVAINADNTVTYTPAANYNGTDSFTYVAKDAANALSGSATVTVTITAVNDVPSFTKGGNQTVAQNAPAQTVSGWATAISAGPADESAQVLNFIVSNNNNALFSAQPSVSASGALTYTPATGASGSATVTVQIHDNGGVANGGVDTSASQFFTITVTGPPTLTINDVSVVEGNSGTTLVVFTVTLNPAAAANVTVAYQTLSGTATAGRDFQVASGTLTFTPGQVTKNITVNVIGETDQGIERDLHRPPVLADNAVIGDSDGLGTIIDDDQTPECSRCSRRRSARAIPARRSMTFAIMPTNGNADTMTVDYRTIPGAVDRGRCGLRRDQRHGRLPGGNRRIRSSSPFR